MATTRLTQTGTGGRPYPAGAFDGKSQQTEFPRPSIDGPFTRHMQIGIGGRRYGSFAGKEAASEIEIVRTPGGGYIAPSGWYWLRDRDEEREEIVAEAAEEVRAIAAESDYRIPRKTLARMTQSALGRVAERAEIPDVTAAIARLEQLIAANAFRRRIEREAAELAALIALQRAIEEIRRREYEMMIEDEAILLLLLA